MADVTGGIGSVPPPGAPREVSQPLTAEDIARQLALARSNERELKPFDPKPEDQIVPVHQEPSQTVEASDNTPNAAEKLLAESRAHQPAASESDSPSRGMPKPITDPGKVITGGFGHVGEAQYYALNGLEVAALVRAQMDKMSTRIENDLRFSMALTYPKIQVRLKLEVESYAQNAGIELEYLGVPEKQTPIDIATQHADKVCFVLIERQQEFDANGEPEDPPDRIREGLGLSVPRKQMVDSGMGKQIVDIVPDVPDLRESF